MALEQWTTPLDGGVPAGGLLGTLGHAVMRRCMQSSEVFSGRRITCRCPHPGRSLTSSSFPSRCLSTAPDVPVAPPDESRSRRFGRCLKSPRSANAVGGPITFLFRFHPTRGQVLVRVPGRPLCSERSCSDAMATGGGRLHGPWTLREEERLQEAHRVHNAPEDTYERRRSHTGYARRMRPVTPVL